MEHYVTYFDSLFLPQGLTLHKSMEKHAGDYLLWILCIDNHTYDVLERLNLPNIRLLKLETLETDELRSIKKERTKGEYCWTLTPFTMKFVFDADGSVMHVTYLDADLWFRKSPNPILREFEESRKSVLITDHAFAAEFDQSALFGQYCVQFMTFKRDMAGEIVRKWWEERCIEWCYNKTEDGKFGDQKYLDNWPDQFSEYVHVLKNKELMLAPWNATRFPYGNSILWHFHGLRLSGTAHNKFIYYGGYPLPPLTKRNIYKPYISDLISSIKTLQRYGSKFQSQIKFRTGLFTHFKSIIKGIYQQLWKIDIYSNRSINYYKIIEK
jgi:hypothetical protein